ncbi:RNase HII [Pontibacter ummariensis]|uniref:Ribonuclease HII n=1 Tax=Pontibacter ummariensis TaxID=1610492 RepID=A0A239E7Z3_9BACT|nr:ribonuclease HII [Pontibacter ummariensis]PRY13130.1 RNase HII [Pontibacter ummariensis]SNS40766.1 RNase HII [Pontibacter ummariensis]
MLLSNHSGYLLEAGVDEVGRGCLAGPVVAAAVVLPADYRHGLLNDSKKLTRAQRELLREDIFKDAVAWAIGEASPAEIDSVNILNATYLAMHRALDLLQKQPEYLLVDGNRFKPYRDLPYACMVKGDGRYLSIAAASVLAKTYRDDLMGKLGLDYPHYGWENNAGYPTKQHREGIMQHGVTAHHRQSFTLLPEQLDLVVS